MAKPRKRNTQLKANVKKPETDKVKKIEKPIEKTIEKPDEKIKKPENIENIENIEEAKIVEKKKPVKSDDEKIPEAKHPYTEQVDEKDYAVMKPIGSEKLDGAMIPEQKIIPPTIDEFIKNSNGDEKKDEKPKEQSASTPNEVKAEKPKNVFENEFDGSIDKTGSSERLAKFTIRMYKYLWLGVGKLTNITPEVVAKRIQEGKLHPQILEFEIEVEKGTIMTVLEIVEDASDKIDVVTTLSEDKEKELLALLSDYFISKGWGLSKELELIFEFGEHLVSTTIDLVSTRMTVNAVLRAVNTQLSGTSDKKPPIDTKEKTEPKKEVVKETIKEEVIKEVVVEDAIEDTTEIEITEPEEKAKSITPR